MYLKLSAAFIILIMINSACNNNGKENKTTAAVVDATQPASIDINPDSVLFSFVFMGCNRLDHKQVQNDNPSTANLPQLQRTFEEVCLLNPKPTFYFFLGDMVLGLDQNLSKLQKELKAWRNLYADTSFSNISTSGIQMIAVPGNHEMLFYDKSIDYEQPNTGAMAIWNKEMKDFMPAGSINVNHIGGNDSLTNLATFSFDYLNTHFIIINTDTYDTSHTIGMAPAAWISADIVAARNNPSIKHIYLLGHKPAVVSDGLYQPGGESIMDMSVIKAIWPVMDSNKVEAMLSAHSHQYYRTQPDPKMSYQIIAGNGGSPYEGDIEHSTDTTHQFFGYTIIYVMKNGNSILKTMGRTALPKTYSQPIPPGTPTTVRDIANISWGTKALPFH